MYDFCSTNSHYKNKTGKVYKEYHTGDPQTSCYFGMPGRHNINIVAFTKQIVNLVCFPSCVYLLYRINIEKQPL